MKNKWEKKGKIIDVQSNLPWMKTHTMIPTVDHISENNFRVYFSGRDDDNRSQIGYADIIIVGESIELIGYSEKPILTHGKLGCFDDCGVTPSSIVSHEEEKYLYYIGWKRSSSVRMGLIGGLAISENEGKTFKRYSRAPILNNTDSEPFSIQTAPFVLKEKDIWRMWYVSCVEWVNPDLPRYNIKYAESLDGINWKRDGVIAIDFIDSDENALARPCVLNDNGIYRMWFSYKSFKLPFYRMGYAESIDGIQWKRMDNLAGIDVTSNSFDSKMIEYPNVIKHCGRMYMFYNGDNYGADGIGLAVKAEY